MVETIKPDGFTYVERWKTEVIQLANILFLEKMRCAHVNRTPDLSKPSDSTAPSYIDKIIVFNLESTNTL